MRATSYIYWQKLLLLGTALIMPAMANAAPFDPETATRAYLATVNGAARAKSNAYFEGGYWLLLGNFIATFLVSWLLLQSGYAVRLRNRVEQLTRRRPLQIILFALLYLLIAAVLTLPLSFYESFLREHQYGLSTQTVGSWSRDFLVGQAVNILILSLIMAGVYRALRAAPRAWWLWATGLTGVFMTLGIALAPVFIAPLFNTYTPLADSPVKAQILSMARANSVPVDNVYQFDASRQTNRISANVSGIGKTIRVSLNDNLLNQGTPAEIKAVMGHELGHYVLGHSASLILMFTATFMVGFLFTQGVMGFLLRRYGRQWGLRGLDDVAGMPALFAVFGLFLLLATPVTNSITRFVEVQADIFGLNAAREPDGFATTSLKLSTYRKLEPSPLEEIIFFDHPSGAARIRMAMNWKAENMTSVSEAKSVSQDKRATPE